MAYINAEQVSQIRKALKANFPGFKFSVRKDRNSSVDVTVLSGPVSFDDALTVQKSYYDPEKVGTKRDYVDVNPYHCNEDNYGKDATLLNQMLEVIKTGSDRKYFDESDAMTDYFHVAFYYSLKIGTYDKPYEVK